jgi:hypothetical protein
LKGVTARPWASIGDENVGCAPAISRAGAARCEVRDSHDLRTEEGPLAADLVLKIAIVGLCIFSTVLASMLFFNL